MTVQLTEPQEVKSDLWFTAKKYGYSITLLVPALGIFFGYLAYAQQNPMWLWWAAAITFLAVTIERH